MRTSNKSLYKGGPITILLAQIKEKENVWKTVDILVSGFLTIWTPFSLIHFTQWRQIYFLEIWNVGLRGGDNLVIKISISRVTFSSWVTKSSR